MADAVTYEAVASMAAKLPAEDRRRLAEQLIAQTLAPPLEKRSVMEFCGIVPYPYLGEDAQAWITRTRNEDDAQREQAWRRS